MFAKLIRIFKITDEGLMFHKDIQTSHAVDNIDFDTVKCSNLLSHLMYCIEISGKPGSHRRNPREFVAGPCTIED